MIFDNMARIHVTVIIEKASDGDFGCCLEKPFPPYGLAGYGETIEEAKHDFEDSYREMREIYADQAKALPELEFIYKYDIAPSSTISPI